MPSFRLCVASLLLALALAASAFAQNDKPAEPAAFIPTGACCIQPAPNQPLICIDGITYASCIAAQGIWQGNGSACGIASCAPIGACCFIQPGTIGYQCTQTAEAICYQLAYGVYFGDASVCTPDLCPTCVLPPKSLAGWWTFDEPISGNAFDSAAINHGIPLPAIATGPGVAGSFVNLFRFFDGVDDAFYIPHSNSITIGSQDFTIDAWVARFDNATTQSIFNKGQSNITSNGYLYGVNAFSQPFFMYYPGSFIPTTYTSTATVPFNTWTHLAITGTVSGGSRTLRFYKNGVLTDTFAGAQGFIPDSPGFFNFAAAFIGAYGGTGLPWFGDIDELELHMQALSDADIAAIYAMGTHGKCKNRVYAQWDTPFCLNVNSVTVPVTIYNYSSNPALYNLSFSPTNSCSIPGPTVFTPNFSNPVAVPGNGNSTVTVTIQRPTGMNAALQTSCYLVAATEVGSGFSFYGHGLLEDRRDICGQIDPCCLLADVELIVTQPRDLSVTFTNTSSDPILTPLMVQALDSDTMQPVQVISLNGLPPGTRYIGDLVLPPNASAPVSVAVRYLAHHPVGRDDLVFFSDVDADGVHEPLVSIGMHSRPMACSADIAPRGGGGGGGGTTSLRDGIVNIDDLTEIILNWATSDPNADIDDSGSVDIDDLTIVILAWGPCP